MDNAQNEVKSSVYNADREQMLVFLGLHRRTIIVFFSSLIGQIVKTNNKYLFF